MYKCPHCNKPGISTLRKVFLGAAVSATCKQCGKKVGVPYLKSMIFVPLFIAAYALGNLMDDATLKMIIWVVGFFIIEVIYLKWVPLIRK